EDFPVDGNLIENLDLGKQHSPALPAGAAHADVAGFDRLVEEDAVRINQPSSRREVLELGRVIAFPRDIVGRGIEGQAPSPRSGSSHHSTAKLRWRRLPTTVPAPRLGPKTAAASGLLEPGSAGRTGEPAAVPAAHESAALASELPPT